jgi:hypothetical protein
MGLPEWIVDGFGELALGFADGYADLTTDNVESSPVTRPCDFERFANDFKQAWE